MANVTVLSAENFEEQVLKADKPYLVDFWAEWCGPCRAVAPIVAQIAEEYADKINVGKVNVDENRELAQTYRIISIPALMLFKDGEVATTVVGAMPKEELLERLSSFF